MSNKITIKPLAAAVGTALALSFAAAPIASADVSPFSLTALSSGYMAADIQHDAKFGEGKCGEGKCGGDKGEEGSCGGDKGEGDDQDGHEDDEKGAEGSCGGDKGAEGKCGEGKCGGSV